MYREKRQVKNARVKKKTPDDLCGLCLVGGESREKNLEISFHVLKGR